MAEALLNRRVPPMWNLPRHRSARGFSLIDVLMTVALVGIIAGIATPLMVGVAGSLKLTIAARDVERELQTARLRAVSSNRPMRLRFNCPATGQFRIVELIGTTAAPATADSAVNRCDLSQYSYPAADRNVLTRPNNDGPVRSFDSSVTFTAVQTIEFWPDGTAHFDAGATNPWPQISTAGVSLTLTRSGVTKTITVNGLGKVQLQP